MYKYIRLHHLNYISDIEVTGNPLEYSFGDDKFINSTLIIERYWYQEEESYIPLSRIEAW